MPPVYNTAVFNNIVLSAFEALFSQGVLTLNLAASNAWRIELTENITTFNVIGLAEVTNQLNAFQLFILGNGNSYDITWPAGTLWANATPPVLTGGIDIVQLESYDMGMTWYGFTLGQAFG